MKTHILVLSLLLGYGPSLLAAETECPYSPQHPKYHSDPQCVGGSSDRFESMSVDELTQELARLTERMKSGDRSAAPQMIQVQQVLQRKVMAQYDTTGLHGATVTAASGDAPCSDPAQKMSNYDKCCFPNEVFSVADLSAGVVCSTSTSGGPEKRYYKMAGQSCFYRVDRNELIEIQTFKVTTTYLEEYNWLGPSCSTGAASNNSRGALSLVANSGGGTECKVANIEESFFETETSACTCDNGQLNYRDLEKDRNPLSQNFEVLQFDRCSCDVCSPNPLTR